MYTLADAISVRADWGHSSNMVGIELCQVARVRQLCLLLHESAFDDHRIADIIEQSRRLEAISRTNRPL